MFHMILLAAGFSSRFGSNKLLYEMDGKPMYRHLFDRLEAIAGEDNLETDLTVVTQYHEIGDALEGRNCFVTYNEDPSRGISSSLITGIQSLQERGVIEDGDYLVFFTADQPYLQKETVEDFLSAVEYMEKGLAAVAVEEKMLNPCAFSTEYIPELLALKGDKGGKQVLRKHEDEIFLFQVDSEEELVDIDRL
ncbi:MAG: nucleotidyltransferase family protein [Lachnospiraceae bacterium]|nr:nucleotidyltransferase family protein [Lachnospiraceae bacterium]